MGEQRKLAAIMFTDIVGYSARMSKDEKRAIIDHSITVQKEIGKTKEKSIIVLPFEIIRPISRASLNH